MWALAVLCLLGTAYLGWCEDEETGEAEQSQAPPVVILPPEKPSNASPTP